MNDLIESMLKAGFFGALFIIGLFITPNMTTGIPFMLSLLFTMATLDLFLFQIFGIGFWFDDLKEFKKMMKGESDDKIDNQEVRQVRV